VEYEPGLGCSHCDWAGYTLQERADHMNQAHPGENQFDPEIDHMINRLKDIDDQDYEKMTGPWSEVFPNPNPAPQKWPEGTDKPSDGHKWPKITIVRKDDDDDTHTASVKIAAGEPYTCPHCDKNQISKQAIDYAYEYNECPDCGGYIDNEGPGGTELTNDYQNSWRESSKQLHILTICDGCGAKNNNSLDPYNEWVNEGSEDYCPDCAYDLCHNCNCNDYYPEIDHLSSCNRFDKGGNCSCPPCGCDCHV